MLRRLYTLCSKCRFVNTCPHKKMEMLGELQMKNTLADTAAERIISSISVPHDFRQLKNADGKTVTVDLEELKKKLEEDIKKGLHPDTFLHC